MSFHVVEHPIAKHALTILRDKTTTLNQFREACMQAVPIVLMAATSHLELQEKKIETPLCWMDGFQLKNDVVLIPILRAGVSMLDAALKFMPFAKVGYFGMARDEKTAIASTYYQKLPKIEGSHVILLDPMLATGGSAAYAIEQIRKLNPKTLTFASIVSAPEGKRAILDKFKDIDVYTLAEDERLDERKYIVPGLGDFGDRYHGTDDY